MEQETKDAAPNHSSVMGAIYGDPLFRAASLGLFCAGVGVSSTTPLLTLFIVRELGASWSVASLYFATALVGPIISMLVGKMSDRLPNRSRLIQLSAIWISLGWILMSVSQHTWMIYAIGIVFMSFMGTFSAQIFASVRDHIVFMEMPNESQIVSAIRVAYSAGWIIGPVVGAWFGLTYGLRPLFICAALLYFTGQFPFRRFRTDVRQVRYHESDDENRPAISAKPLLFFSMLCALLMSAETLKLSFLPVFMEVELQMQSWATGSVVSMQPILELLMIPIIGTIAMKVGEWRVLVAGIIMGAIGYILFALANDIWMLFAGQFLAALLVSSILGLGVTVAQNLYPRGSGYASSMFFGFLGLSGAIGGVMGSIGSLWLGVPGVFALPIVACTFSLVAIWAARAHLSVSQ